VHETSGHNTCPHHLLGRRLIGALAATLLSCGTLNCRAVDRVIDAENRQPAPADANDARAASDTGAPGATPQRWICADGTSVNFEYSSPHLIAFECATLKDLVGEFNRYATTWHFLYSGPDSVEVLEGVFQLDHPEAEEEMLATLKRDFGVKVEKRNPSNQTIVLKPPARTDKAPPRRPAPRSLNVDRDWDGRGGQECEDIQFDDGRGGMWCRHSTLGRMLAGFNRHNEWQLSLVDASLSEFIADGLFAYDDLDGLLRYLKTDQVVEGSRAIDLHQIRLVRSAHD
jgi:hypothetical protein